MKEGTGREPMPATEISHDVGESWAGTYRYRASALYRPRTVGQLQEIVASASHVRALGSRHSFNGIADSPGVLVNLDGIELPIEIERGGGSAWVPAGKPYGHVADLLHRKGLALRNLGSLPHISVGGACAVATHGSGSANRNLSASVIGMEVVDASGSVSRLTRSETPDFAGLVVHLGMLGIVTRLQLEVVPSFEMRQDVFVDVPSTSVVSDIDAIMDSAYSVSVFTKWSPQSRSEVWQKRLATERCDMIMQLGASAQVASPAGETNTTTAGGVGGPWHERLPHFRFDSSPSNGDEIQTEYFVHRADARRALRAVAELWEEIDPSLHITELRTIAADDLWMSPSFERDSLAIHFTWRKDPERVSRLLPRIESALAPFEPRSHWGKWSTLLARSMRDSYPRMGDFLDTIRTRDPEGKFRNDWVDRVLAVRST